MHLMQFDSFSMEGPLPPYYALDSCCLISDILEMVIFCYLLLMLVYAFRNLTQVSNSVTFLPEL